MILHPILAKSEVLNVTVVEKYRDVIDLISPTLPSPKLNVICADILKWKPVMGIKYDTIYFDIWPDICTDNLIEVRKLYQRFKSCKSAGGWMRAWMHDYLKQIKRRDGKRGH